MSRINEETVSEIRNRSDISSDLHYCRCGGPGPITWAVPFHQEKSPSFNVNAPDRSFTASAAGRRQCLHLRMRMEG